MKKLNHFFGAYFVLLLFVSCATKDYELVEVTSEKYLEANSNTVDIVQRISMNNGSLDDIIDNANCFSIQLPFVLMVNNQQMIIKSENDYDLLYSIFDESNTDLEYLKIIYPIVLVNSDYSEVIVNSEEEITRLVSVCNEKDVVDNQLDCIDFVYPISASQFNKTKESTSTNSIYNDKELYDFIVALNQDLVISFNFPITMILSNGSNIEINDLKALETAIYDVEDLCEEDDFYQNISTNKLSELLTSCILNIKEFEVYDEDFMDAYNQFDLMFYDDGSINAIINGLNSSGLWEVTKDKNASVHLNISMDSINALNNDWILSAIKIEKNTIIELKIEESELILEQDCE